MAMDASPALRFRSVLVAVDGSAHAALALRQAIALAQRDHARLTVLTVVAHVRDVAAGAWSVPVDPIALQEQADREAQDLLRGALETVPDDLPVASRVRHGHAGPEIVAEVRESDHDAVLLGARGVGRIGTLAGSVSTYVLHHAKVAVFVAHAPDAP
jgi:nucleotide-binding universal stress UspA family protein